MKRLGDWLDVRIGHRALLHTLFDEPVPGGARFTYVLGSALVFVLGLQVVTGMLMAAFYAPSATDAWASVAFLQQQVTLGWFIRGLHSAGASAMVILTALHLLQVTIWGAYRKPREVNWWVGLALMLTLFAFALTGYLLPWDQKGYWATQVATSLVGAMPIVGPWLKRFVQGGSEYGNLTLTHFYALHTLALPALMVALTVVHVALMRRHGVTPGWKRKREPQVSAPFSPDQLLRDLIAMALVLAVMVLVVVHGHGAGLEAPADPSSAYDARPEWYFLPLYQLLKYFPGPLEVVAAIGVPLVAGGVLFFLPLVDRGSDRAPGARKALIFAVVAILGGAVTLGVLASRADKHNAAYQKSRVQAEAESRRALALATKGVPPAGGVAVYENDPVERARTVYAERCGGCHTYQGAGERKAPDLDGWSSRGWIRAFLKDPENDRFYGKTRVRGMKPVKPTGADFDALVEWVYSLGGSRGVNAKLAARGREVFESESCDECHDTDGIKGEGDGTPNLGGRASPEWLKAFLTDPGGDRFFGRKNDMPKVAAKLSDDELEAVIDWLGRERAR
ncbi:MAG TPA: cytochrome b N-terminal domain-containing protein [Polyangia bacterium]